MSDTACADQNDSPHLVCRHARDELPLGDIELLDARERGQAAAATAATATGGPVNDPDAQPVLMS